MAEKKQEQSSFTVTDRRLFTMDGELRSDVSDDQKSDAPKEARKDEREPAKTTQAPAGSAAAQPPTAPSAEASSPIDRDMPVPPTSAEQEAQAAAYRASSKELDEQVKQSGHSTKDFEMTFERFMASLYMTAMLQLGLMRHQGEQPSVDIIGARQTIDTLSLIAEKTKGNLTVAEENFLQNSLYELRMAYVEVTNALARPPQAGPHAGPKTGTTGR
jgi:hypothetical protein